MAAHRFAIALVWTALICAGAQAADLSGSRDPAGLKRFQGSDIVHYTTSTYDRYVLARGEGNPGSGFAKSEEVDGQITRIVYRIPMGHSAFEVFHNYEQTLAGAGFTQTFELAKGRIDYDGAFFEKFADKDMGSLIYDNDEHNCYYATYAATAHGQTTTVVIFAVASNGPLWSDPVIKAPPYQLIKGQALIAVDVIVGGALRDEMVAVKAADIADALATKGVFDLYGVYFDTDKTDVKPESTATLDEVASLLKIDRSLKLEISGHTDNTGAKDHNLKLSQGRAQAVVNILVTKYGIDPKRLVAQGYGDTKPVVPNDNDADRAKNRRVELRKL